MDAPQKKPSHLKPLTPRMRRFIGEYLNDFDGAQTAVRAGYEPSDAGIRASELRNITAHASARSGLPQKCGQMWYSPGVSTKNESNFAALSGQRPQAYVPHRAKFDPEPRESLPISCSLARGIVLAPEMLTNVNNGPKKPRTCWKS